MQTYPKIGLAVPKAMVPVKEVDLGRWAVVACDQYTSDLTYWQKVEDLVGEEPSTLKLVLPEVYLEDPEVGQRIELIHKVMDRYINDRVLEEKEGFVYVRREVGGKTREGLLVALDLECYDYKKESTSLVRATEGTIEDRIPPRLRVREGALLELPHIMVLIDDVGKSVIEPLSGHVTKMAKLYETELMMKGGRVSGWLLGKAEEKAVVGALDGLLDKANDGATLLYAMGDGNHSLATAKAWWEKIKDQVGPEHPARWALVELVNIHSDALQFEAIHRVLFGLTIDINQAIRAFFGPVESKEVSDVEELTREVDEKGVGRQRFGIVDQTGQRVITLTKPMAKITVGSVQKFLDDVVASGGATKIDYVHGGETVAEVGQRSGNVGIYLPAMQKNELFEAVKADGALPRKTFSMGEAHEKRFYLEARKITE